VNSIVSKVMVIGLFEEGNDYLIDFKEGSNCLFGDNGTGKTTMINLIVAGIEADLKVLMEVHFDYLSISVINDEGDVNEIVVVKGNSNKSDEDDEEFYGDGLKELLVSVNGSEFQFNYKVDNEERHAKKGMRTRKYHLMKTFLNKLVNLTHVPLLRMRTDVTVFDQDGHEFDFDAWEGRSSVDTSTSVLFEIEKKFKSLADGYRTKDTRKLEEFKSQIIQKFLIDKNSLNDMNEMSREAGIHYHNQTDVEGLVEKLDSAGLSVPKSKLIDNFNLLSELSEESQRQFELSSSIRDSGASEEEIVEVNMDMSRSVIDVLVSRALFQRFQSVITDVEDLQADRGVLWNLFADYENIVNKFLNNKSFKLEKSGEFKIYSGIRPVKLNDLSSGEKHILVILGRAALSKEKGSVFIADEPELSLHLTWQRMMLPSILELSPKSQIIVATHSPAIIPRNANKIDLGECR
jgi:predicted ATPase